MASDNLETWVKGLKKEKLPKRDPKRAMNEKQRKDNKDKKEKG
jgi:hypothetical protein